MSDRPHDPALASPRLHWMDFLRGLAVLLVVVMHSNEHGGVALPWWTDANEYLAPYRMPLLMFLSGLLVERSVAKPLPQYVRGKITAIAWPLAVWLVLYGLLARDGFGIPADPFRYLTSGDYLWFLIALLACYGLTVLFKPLIAALPETHHWGYLLVFAAAVLLATAVAVEPGLRGNTLWYGAFFFLGAWARPSLRRWLDAPWAAVVPVLLLVAAASYATVRAGVPSFASLIGAGLSALGIAVIVWIAPRLPQSAFQRFVTWCGRSSIVVYVVHFPVLVLLRDRVLPAGALPDTAHVLVLTAATLAITVLFVWARPWTPWLYTMPQHLQQIGRRGT
ncbi:acyltransferase [Zhihengliuella sp.]|uniref:acyltransferase n=1 Tax=Zhihengliuella sp. TaxID=1954483 RepID=UPI0028110259|nr:acyltransferase [Zhihengliuella sp.]